MWSLFRSPASVLQPQSTWQRFRYYTETYQRGDILRWLGEHLQKPEEAERMLTAWIETDRLETVDKGGALYRVGRKDDYNENTVMLYEQIKKDKDRDSDTNWVAQVCFSLPPQLV